MTDDEAQLETEAKKLVRSLDQKPKPQGVKTALVIFSIIFAGVLSGLGLSVISRGRMSIGGQKPKSSEEIAQAGVKVGDVVGIKDKETFRDNAEGVLVTGGVDGEGSHHLVRPGGKSQNVYLTSSIVDLDLFVDHQVKVWGETFAAQRAGWLMDVGRVEVIELNAELP